MNELTIFTYGESPIRTMQQNGEIWWVLADVCAVLQIKNVTQAAQRLDEDERAMFDIGLKTGSLANCINEPGLYSVILRSDKPEAKQFKRWVTHEVLPTIRKNGSYGNEKMEIAKLIASCKSATAVKGILSLYGVSTNIALTTSKILAESVTEYLKTVETWELTEIPCRHVYEDYVSFCKDYGFYPLNLSTFSKAIHQCAGLVVRRHRVNGEITGFYT